MRHPIMVCEFHFLQQCGNSANWYTLVTFLTLLASRKSKWDNHHSDARCPHKPLPADVIVIYVIHILSWIVSSGQHYQQTFCICITINCNKQGQLTQHCSHLLLNIVLLPATLLQIWIDRWPQLLLTSSAAIDQYCLPAGPTAANPPRWRVMGECSDRPTDGQMVGHHTVT